MNEIQRREYLSAMGIDLYCPREILPTEKQIKERVLNELDKNPSGSGASKVSEILNLSHELHRPSGAEQPDVSHAKRKRRERSEAHSIIKGKPPTTSNQKDLHFSVNFYFLDKRLAILEEVMRGETASDRRKSSDLMSNVLSALGVGLKSYSFEGENISWPVAKEFSMIGDQASAARQMLFGFIKRKSHQNEFANLLVFAETISGFYLKTEKGVIVRDYFNQEEKFYLTVTHTLQSMIDRPQLKKDVWQQLQPLRGRLISD